MCNLEKRVLLWIEKNIRAIGIVSLSILSVMIRYSLHTETSWDATYCLLPWYEEIQDNGGLKALSVQVGNYSIVYQCIIALITYLPISSLGAYKIVSCFFDYVLASAVGYLVYSLSSHNKSNKGIMAYLVVVFSPVVFLNSGSWAQCDSIYTSFCILTLIALLKRKKFLAFVFYGCAFAFKLQAVFLLPFLLFYYFYKRNFTIFYFVVVPMMMIILSVPGLVMGRRIRDIFGIYAGQANEYLAMTYKYPNIWAMLVGDGVDRFSSTLRPVALYLTVAVLAIIMIVFIVKNVNIDATNYVYIAFLLTYTTVYFLPSMHERYGFLYEILAIILMFLVPGTWPLTLGLQLISLFTYGCFLYGYSIADYRVLGVVNTMIYIAYIALFFKRSRSDGGIGTRQI